MKAIHYEIVLQQVGLFLLDSEKMMKKLFFFFSFKINQNIEVLVGVMPVHKTVLLDKMCGWDN